MLSRVADNLYWMARFMERAENLARLLQALLRAVPPQLCAVLPQCSAQQLVLRGGARRLRTGASGAP